MKWALRAKYPEDSPQQLAQRYEEQKQFREFQEACAFFFLLLSALSCLDCGGCCSPVAPAAEGSVSFFLSFTISFSCSR